VNINIRVNNGSEKFFKKTATVSKLIIAVYASVVHVYISCTCLSSWLEYNSLFVGLGGWGARGSEQKIWLITWMSSMFRV
jgi:hypothetical protein